MNRKLIGILAVAIIAGIVCGCQKKVIQEESGQRADVEVPKTEEDSKTEENSITEENPITEEEPAADQASGTKENPAAGEGASNLENTDLAILGSEDTKLYLISNPSWEYYMSDQYAVDELLLRPFEFVQVTSETNQITDTEAWFSQNNLPSNFNEDEKYRYEIKNNAEIGETSLNIYDKSTKQLVMVLDFSDYCYADDYEESNKPYIDQNITAVKRRDSILYVSTGHYTYAEFSPSTSYLTAIDLDNGEVIWKSEPLVNNAQCFEIIGNIIVCGYGFTAEDDFLIQLDIRTGKVLEKQLIKSAPTYIKKKDDLLYVRTYDTNYIFEIKGELP